MANLFIRITDVISSNINHMIDRVEDPERMIKQIILEMEDHIRRAEDSVIDAIASEKQLSRELQHHRDQVDLWQQKAETALTAGNEELARAALMRKKEHEKTARNMESAWEAAADTSRTLKSKLRDLQNKLEEARRKRSSLVARQRAAEASQYMRKTQNHFRRGLDARDKFVRMEDRVLEIEARTEAIAELYDDSSDLERDIEQLAVKTEVDGELAELRKKNKKDKE
jgi:phage shock protein A